MPDTIRIALDILALLAVLYAVIKGLFSASADAVALKAQLVRNTAWIEGHEKWSQQQTEEIQAIREDIAYIRGKIEVAEART